MKKWLFLIILILLILIILIAIFANGDASHVSGNYSNIETQMKKLWY